MYLLDPRRVRLVHGDVHYGDADYDTVSIQHVCSHSRFVFCLQSSNLRERRNVHAVYITHCAAKSNIEDNL